MSSSHKAMKHRRNVAVEPEATTFPTWKLKEVVHRLRAKDQLIGLPALCALIRFSMRPNRRVFVAQASRSSRARAPRGTRIHSVRR